MKINHNLPKELLLEADFMNTIGGGVSTSKVNLTRNDELYTVEILTYGISPEILQVDVIEDKLVVYYKMQLFKNQQFVDEDLSVPVFIANLPIPVDVDVENISAKFEDKKLYIIAPRSESSSKGFRKKIEIERP